MAGKGSKPTYPKGPVSLPFIGHRMLLGREAHEKLREAGNKYDGIFSISVYNQPTVVIDSAKILKEVLSEKGQDFNGRAPLRRYQDMLSHGNRGILLAEEPYWRVIRKLTDVALKMVEIEQWEKCVEEEAKKLIAVFKQVEGRIFDPGREIEITVINIFCKMIFGASYKRDDKEFLNICQNFQFLQEHSWKTSAEDTIPLARFFPDGDATSTYRMSVAGKDALFRRKLVEHKASMQPGTNRDLADAFLRARDLLQPEDPDIKITDEYIEISLWDFFSEGVATVTSVMKWLLLYVSLYDDINAKLEEELRVIEARTVKFSQDKDKLQYLQAVILETLRMSPPHALSVLHRATLATTIRQYTIPKNTLLMFNLWAIQRDINVYTYPELFLPARFLDTETLKLLPEDQWRIYSFGLGPRKCPGREPAMIQLFALSAAFFQNFNVKMPISGKVPSLTGKLEDVLQPEKYEIVINSHPDYTEGDEEK